MFVRPARWLAMVPAALAALALTACTSGGTSTPARASDAVAVSVSVSDCGQGWDDHRAGPLHFVLHNTDTRSGEVDLVAATGGAVYAEVEPLGAGTSAAFDADLGAGRYAFRCYMEDEPAVDGPVVRLTGSVRGDTPAVLPVSQGDLIGATKAYETYVTRRLPGLAAMVGRLRGDVDAGQLARARADWLPAHLAYQRLGAAYGAFGDIDADINGLADGLPAGVRDPSWRGFHRLEYGLWHGQPAATLRPVAAHLVADVATLRRTFPKAEIDPLDIGLRAHEITEDAVRFALAGRDDYGSGSGLATVRADLDGTQAVLDVVRPLITPRYRTMSTVESDLRGAEYDLDALHTAHGRWVAPTALPRPSRERIDSDLGGLAEELAPVATILEPRRTS